ncbi:MAG: GIY-YIG nuclease family protein [Sneathiellaceae bacterium]
MAGAWVYTLANRPNGTLYTGVTADLARRVLQHREGRGSGFARRHGIRRLVHAERHDAVSTAIAREKTMKRWRRAWKIALIEAGNPDWQDLWDSMQA